MHLDKEPQEIKLTKEELIASLLAKENKTKIDFIKLLSESEIYDVILGYLLECANIIAKIDSSKIDSNKANLAKLEPLRAFYASLNLKFNTQTTP